MHRRTQARVRGADPPARFEDSTVEYSDPEAKSKYSKTRRVQKRSQHPLVELIKNKPVQMANDFFNARTGAQGCFVAGVIRCSYACLYLYSTILMTIQMPTLFDPRKGLMPYFITGESDAEDDEDDYSYSIFEFAPKSSLLMYAMFLLGVTSGFLLLLGIEPRKGAIGAYFFLYNMQFHNDKIFDHEFFMSKTWAFFLILLPLDHFTMYDDFGGYASVLRRRLNLPSPQQGRGNKSSSWPMWPFRLWQIYTCMVYMGAGFGKLNSDEWTSGNALSWLWYDEGVGRLYPAFVVELLFNRLISIKLQTWLALLIENFCFITIWPLKTRKITFVAIVLLHIGIELSLIMHIFEYLSVLGWVCFFVYPNDGQSKTETLIKNKKSEGEKWTPANAFGSKKSKTIEIAVAVSLLYLLIYDIFPREEAEQLMPSPLAYLAYFFVYPPAFINTKLDALTHLIGISSGPYLLFQGTPAHMQTRMTAVIRFSDGKEPILHEDVDWSTSSFLQRELNYWYDTYSYYLYEDIVDADEIPYFAALSVHLAELYGKGGVDRQYDKITIDPNNTIESVSIKVHRRDGSELPAPPGWGLFSSIPREWRYLSLCQFVFTPDMVQLENQKFTFPMNQMWNSPDDAEYHIKNGCVNLNPEDEELHSKGQYGESFIDDEEENPDDGEGDEEYGEQSEVGPNADDGEDTPAIDQDDNADGEENPNNGGGGEGDDASNHIEPNGGADEEDDGEDGEAVSEYGRLIQENDDEDGEENEGEDEEPSVLESVRIIENDGEADEEDEGADTENNDEDGSPDSGEEEDSGNETDDGPPVPNGGEDGEDGEDGGSDDDEQNHRQLRSRSW